MTIKRLLKKYKRKYKLSVMDQGNWTSMALMYVGGERSSDEKAFYTHLLNTGVISYEDFLPPLQLTIPLSSPIFPDVNASKERIFLLYLVNKGEIDKDEIEMFRKRMFTYHKNHMPSTIISATFGIIVITLLLFVIFARFIF